MLSLLKPKWIGIVFFASLSLLLYCKKSILPSHLITSPILVASNAWPGYAPLYLAEELGYFDPHIKLKLLTSASDVSL